MDERQEPGISSGLLISIGKHVLVNWSLGMIPGLPHPSTVNIRKDNGSHGQFSTLYEKWA